MATICTFYLVRHGQSVANRDNIVGGHLDSPLSDKGKAQAEEARDLLKPVNFDAAYSSDLLRASKTAEIIYGQPIPLERQLPGLRERNFGKLEGTSADAWHDIDQQYEQHYSSLPIEQRWQYEYADYIEGDKAVYERFSASLQLIAAERPGQTVLIGTHGGPIRILLMKLGYARYLPAGAFLNAGYVVVECDGSNFSLKKVVGVRLTGESSE